MIPIIKIKSFLSLVNLFSCMEGSLVGRVVLFFSQYFFVYTICKKLFYSKWNCWLYPVNVEKREFLECFVFSILDIIVLTLLNFYSSQV